MCPSWHQILVTPLFPELCYGCVREIKQMVTEVWQKTASHVVLLVMIGTGWSLLLHARRHWRLNLFCYMYVHRSRDCQCISVGRTTPKIAASRWWSQSPSNGWFLWPTRDSHPRPRKKRPLIHFSRFRWLTNVTNRETDRSADRSRYVVL